MDEGRDTPTSTAEESPGDPSPGSRSKGRLLVVLILGIALTSIFAWRIDFWRAWLAQGPPTEKDMGHVRKLLMAGKAKEASAYALRCLEKNPTHPKAIAMVADCHIGVGNFAGARKYLEEGLARAPDSVDLQLRLAVTFEADGLVDKAIDVCAVARKAHPDSVPACMLLARLHWKAGRFRDAASEYRDLIRRGHRSPQLSTFLAMCLVGSKDNEGAKKAFYEALRMRPHHGTAAINLGRLLVRQGKIAEARKAFARVRKGDRSYSRARELLRSCDGSEVSSEALRHRSPRPPSDG